MCGGTATIGAAAAHNHGLSPRVRGNRRWCLQPTARGRSIPACAGEPALQRHCPALETVYPRVCGGTNPTLPCFAEVGGLSPRVRGNLQWGALTWVANGSIPACAGEPWATWASQPRRRVYPRVCGGTKQPHAGIGRAHGLSPRVRGNPSYSASMRACSRSIPACAGEPPCNRCSGHGPTVYPRVCGGTRLALNAQVREAGLSPRVRGNPSGTRSTSATSGSIPACAGEPDAVSPSSGPNQVYPRVCGGTAQSHGAGYIPEGLSPRVRGNRVLRQGVASVGRSIPACAGEPLSPPLPA